MNACIITTENIINYSFSFVQDNIGMKVLNVSWNGFGEEGSMAMGVALKTCTLTELDMSNNRVGAEGFVAMVTALKNNDDLKKLIVSLWVIVLSVND